MTISDEMGGMQKESGSEKYKETILAIACVERNIVKPVEREYPEIKFELSISRMQVSYIIVKPV